MLGNSLKYNILIRYIIICIYSRFLSLRSEWHVQPSGKKTFKWRHLLGCIHLISQFFKVSPHDRNKHFVGIKGFCWLVVILERSFFPKAFSTGSAILFRGSDYLLGSGKLDYLYRLGDRLYVPNKYYKSAELYDISWKYPIQKAFG